MSSRLKPIFSQHTFEYVSYSSTRCVSLSTRPSRDRADGALRDRENNGIARIGTAGTVGDADVVILARLRDIREPGAAIRSGDLASGR